MFIAILAALFLMLYFIYDDGWRQWWEEITGMGLDPDLFKGWRFFENFSNKSNAINMGLLYLICFLVVQVFMLPLVPLNGGKALQFFGKMTSSFPPEILLSMKNFLLFVVFPLAFYRNFSEFITKNLLEHPSMGFKKYLRVAGLFLGFFSVLIMQKAFYNIFGMLLALVTTIVIFAVPKYRRKLTIMLQLPKNADFSKTAYFEDMETFLIINIVFLSLYLVSLAFVVDLPGFSFINKKIIYFTSNAAVDFIVNMFIVFVYLIIPILVAKALSKSYSGSLEEIAIENGVDLTSEEYIKFADKNRLQGFILGYIIGHLVIRTGILMTPRKIRSIVTKVLSKLGKMTRRKKIKANVM